MKKKNVPGKPGEDDDQDKARQEEDVSGIAGPEKEEEKQKSIETVPASLGITHCLKQNTIFQDTVLDYIDGCETRYHGDHKKLQSQKNCLTNMDSLYILSTLWKETPEFLTDKQLASAGLARAFETGEITRKILGKALCLSAGEEWTPENYAKYLQRVSRTIGAAMTFGLVELVDETRKDCKPLRTTESLDKLMVEMGARLAIDTLILVKGNPGGSDGENK